MVERILRYTKQNMESDLRFQRRKRPMGAVSDPRKDFLKGTSEPGGAQIDTNREGTGPHQRKGLGYRNTSEFAKHGAFSKRQNDYSWACYYPGLFQNARGEEHELDDLTLRILPVWVMHCASSKQCLCAFWQHWSSSLWLGCGRGENLPTKQVLHHPRLVQHRLVSPNMDNCAVLA